MQKAYLHLIKHALSDADVHSITVVCGEEGDVLCRESTKYAKIKEAVECVDVSVIHFWNSAGQSLGAASVVLEYRQEPDETISDWALTPFMENWWEAYKSTWAAA